MILRDPEVTVDGEPVEVKDFTFKFAPRVDTTSAATIVNGDYFISARIVPRTPAWKSSFYRHRRALTRWWRQARDILSDQFFRIWVVDTDALAELALKMGVAEPIKVTANVAVHRRTGISGRPHSGEHRYDADGHDIVIYSHLSAKRAAEVLRHELRHCMQQETTPSFTRAYSAALDEHGYDDSPYEIDAREHEQDFLDIPALRRLPWYRLALKCFVWFTFTRPVWRA